VNLRKWFFLFWSCTLLGGLVSAITGSIMQWTDESFGFMGLEAAGFNAGMMALAGLLIGAFSQMGFFAYLTLNYIALGFFRKKYLWNAFQGYTTVFAVFLFGYLLYENRAHLNDWMFWSLPAALALGSWIVAKVKVKQTNASALVPTLFLMFVVTVIEAWPSMGEESNASALIFMITPLFACNAYQILMLHRLLKPAQADSGANAKAAS